jgi:hypothetical protein
MWDRLWTRMRLGELASDPGTDCIDLYVGSNRGESGAL